MGLFTFRGDRARHYVDNARDWQQSNGLSAQTIVERYNAGFAGCWRNEVAHERFRDLAKKFGGYSDFADAAQAFGYADAYAGQLVLPFISVVETFNGCFPGPAQERGDCVAHDVRTAGLFTLVGDICRNVADEVTGKLEAAPDISPTGITNLVLASEWNWWQRGYNGDGWDLDSAVEAAIKTGFALRQNYPELGFDLTEYSYANTAKYGRTPPPENAQAMGRLHAITSGADVNSFAELRDALGNGFGVGSDGGEGFSSTRNQYGISRRQGSWSHSYPFIGADDRPEIIKLFGEPLALNCNNWGEWNDGPRDIYQSAGLVPPEKKDLWVKLDLVNPQTGNIMIPRGSWWTPWSAVSRRSFKAVCGFRGWARKALPDYGATGLI